MDVSWFGCASGRKAGITTCLVAGDDAGSDLLDQGRHGRLSASLGRWVRRPRESGGRGGGSEHATHQHGISCILHRSSGIMTCIYIYII